MEKKTFNPGNQDTVGSINKQTIDSLAVERCPRCHSEIFDQKVKLKRLPSVHPLNESGQDAHLPIPVVVCCKCLWVLGEEYDEEKEAAELKEQQEMLQSLFGGGLTMDELIGGERDDGSNNHYHICEDNNCQCETNQVDTD
jgi:hypothetical protein